PRIDAERQEPERGGAASQPPEGGGRSPGDHHRPPRRPASPGPFVAKSSGFRNVNSPFQIASGAITSPSLALKVTPAGCTMPVERPLMIDRGGTSPSSFSSSHTPMNPSLPVFHGDGSSTSGSRPLRGLSMSYGGRYSLLMTAAKILP